MQDVIIKEDDNGQLYFVIEDVIEEDELNHQVKGKDT